MKITMRAFVKRQPDSGEVTIYGNSELDDAGNRGDFDRFGFWDSDDLDQHAIIELKFELPEPQTIPIVKATIVSSAHCGDTK
jgi:hypothetical protein